MNSGLMVRHTLTRMVAEYVAVSIGEHHQGQQAQRQAAHPGDAAGTHPDPPDGRRGPSATGRFATASRANRVPTTPPGQRGRSSLSMQKLAKATKAVAAAAGIGLRSRGATGLNIGQACCLSSGGTYGALPSKNDDSWALYHGHTMVVFARCGMTGTDCSFRKNRKVKVLDSGNSSRTAYAGAKPGSDVSDQIRRV